MVTGRGGQHPANAPLRDGSFLPGSGLALSLPVAAKMWPSAQDAGNKRSTKQLLFVFVMSLCTLGRSPSYAEVPEEPQGGDHIVRNPNISSCSPALLQPPLDQRKKTNKQKPIQLETNCYPRHS